MDQYCVVLCGLAAGAWGDAAAWQPVATALKLDPAEFERRVVAALPRIVRQDLNRDTADRIAQLLHAMHVDARVLPDDPQLVYIERAGASCGPLPQSSLDEFIQPGESYRVHGSTMWLPWPESIDTEFAVPTVEADDADDTPPSASAGDDLIDDMPAAPPTDADDEISELFFEDMPAGADDPPEEVAPISDSADQPGDIAQEYAVADESAESPRTMPPPLPGPAQTPSASAVESSGDVDVTAPDLDETASAHDDGLINPSEDAPASDSSDASDPATPEATEDAAPRRSRTGRLLLLVVLAALAVWAYRYWMADSRVDVPPPAVRTIQPSSTGPGQAMPPAPVIRGGDSAPTPASAASVAAAASTPAPAATTPVPATAASIPASAATAAAPPAATSAPSPATSTAAPADASSGTLPANAGTIRSVQPAPVAATSVAAPPAPAH